MRCTAEYLENTAQLLIRLLSEPAVVGDIVQVGTYSIDGTPQIPAIITFDIESDNVKSGEAHITFTGYWPLPPFVEVTLPDTSMQRIPVVQVQKKNSNWEPLLADQSVDAITPIEPDARRPGESANPYTPEPTLPSDYPDLWVELSLERTDPVRLGAHMVSDDLAYVGGCEGRALSSTQKQEATNAAPYLSYAPVRLEGQFSNSLYNSNFAYDPAWVSPHFDPLPDGWSVNLADPMSVVRIQTTPTDAVLPAMTLRFHQRTGSDVTVPQLITTLTPPLTNGGETFQVILAPSAGNAAGRVQLKTEDDAVASSYYNLSTIGVPTLATLNIGSHTGRVKIIWDQTKSDGEEQILQIVAPISSVYAGGHSYIPTGKTSFADVATLNNIYFGKPWYFNKGSIRVDGSGDDLTQPFSWRLKLGIQTLFKVEEGILSSDFAMSAPLTISAFLPSVLSYKLVWTSPTAFKLVSASGATSVAIPFAINISALDGVVTPLTLEIMSYKTTEGSSVAKRWAYLPN
jgi:hypothetical protein